MPGRKRPVLCQPWEEDECLDYYGMLSLHRMFDIVGSQLTQSDIDALSFLLHETHPFTHPLDPQLWTAEDESGEAMPNSALLSAWQRLNRDSRTLNENKLDSPDLQPKDGTELLLKLERMGKCDESNFTHLLQLLRVLTRHDLLPYVSMKRPRTVSPERYTHGPSILDSDKQMDKCLNPTPSGTSEENWETGSNASKRKRSGTQKRGRCPKPKRNKASNTPSQNPINQSKVTCGKLYSGYVFGHNLMEVNILL
ncbi:hypothetical protein XENTR_v10019202 [Xenopus tropicalis]|uniref:Death effector domain-containing 2 n=1 Tax=Xenopus tropicalis TaxID=8364 RepID=A0A803JTR7_XENTR|nr:hypothetical protein XENTR_v10019202 [Xenopus tropicalis]